MTEIVILPSLLGLLFLPTLLFGLAFTAITVLWLVLLLPGFLIWLWLLARICRKAGFSGWWALTTLFPPVFAIMIWALAFADWPGGPRTAIMPPRRF
jgi:uncharacterized membrane protein YhaH (DUF805 family)